MHDFMIKAGDDTTWITGRYGSGIEAAYLAFGQMEHHAGVSGDGTSVEISHDELMNGCGRLIGFLDDHGVDYRGGSGRFDDFIAFADRLIKADASGTLHGPYKLGFY